MGLEKLNEFKKKKGYTNQQLSQLTGVTLSTIDKITSGNNKNPKFNTIKALCVALECTLDDLMDSPVSSNSSFQLNKIEENAIKKYRSLDVYGQEAVNKILDVEYKRCNSVEKSDNENLIKTNTVRVIKAARSKDNRPVAFTPISKEKLEQLETATPVVNEEDIWLIIKNTP